jgi:carbamate kinase
VRVVIALGGNALLRRGEPPDDASQRRNVAAAAAAIAGIACEHAVVVTHGNGPQVGLLALQAEAYDPGRPHPLDVLGAQTEGMIGYLIEQELRNRLPGRQVATLLTQVAVDADDAAFGHPTKPIGPGYPKDRAERLAAERGWSVAPDGDAYRRVVASPEPRRIIELETIRLLLAAGVLVVCTGGGGIPVVETPAGGLRGIEAVIDKDLAAALLATAIGADALLLLTDVDGVYLGWGTPRAKPLRHATPAAMRRHAFAPGSMGPKVEAACRFAEATGGPAGIGRLADAEGILAGRAGSRVQPERPPG